MELRTADLKWDEIPRERGPESNAGAIAADKVAQERTLHESVQDHRALTLERLTAIIQQQWPRVMSGDLTATDIILRVIEQIRGLMGLDEPKRVAVGGDADSPPVGVTLMDVAAPPTQASPEILQAMRDWLDVAIAAQHEPKVELTVGPGTAR